MQLRYAAAILSLGVGWIAPSWADNCSGQDTLVTKSIETADLGNGLTKTVWAAYSVVTSSDSIYTLLVGECSTTILQTPDGKTQSAGFCARHDKDNDTASIAIHQAPGADKIEWKASGGSGKYADKHDVGWAQQVFAEGPITVTKWGGDCK